MFIIQIIYEEYVEYPVAFSNTYAHLTCCFDSKFAIRFNSEEEARKWARKYLPYPNPEFNIIERD